MSGTASDKVEVTNVQVEVGANGFLPAEGSNKWTFSAFLAPGTNVITAQSVNVSGVTNTARAQRKIIYKPSSRLTLLTTNKQGRITSGDGATNGALLIIGNHYKVTASPVSKSGYLFSNWVSGTNLAALTNAADTPAYTFPMSTNLILQANFVPNPFLALPGTYSGLFMDTSNVTEAGSGFFTLDLMTSGAFSGKITLPGGPHSFSSNFDVGGQVQFTIRAKPEPLTVNLQLNISDPTSEQITGTISNAIWAAELTADRAVFSAKTNKATNYEGQYTLAIPGNTNDSTSPGGFGWAALTISSAGAISMNGSLADGTAISQSSLSVTKDGRWPLYAPYKSPPTTNVGAVFGWMTFSNSPASTLGGPLYWFRPAGATPKAYPGGFTNLAVPVIGSRLSLADDAPALLLTNGQAILEGGTLLPSVLTNDVTINSKNVLEVTSTNYLMSLKLTTNGASAGKVGGSFDYPGTGKKADTTISGVVLQQQNEAVGYFLRTNESGTFLLDNP